MTAPSTLPVSTPPIPAAPPSPWRQLARQFAGNRLAMTSLLVLVAVVVACVAAPLLPVPGATVTDLGHVLGRPSGGHLLGTDQLGRDLLSRVLYGGRSTLLDAFLVSAVAVAVAVPLGLIAAYLGGKADRAVMFVTDIGLSVPAMVVMLVVMTEFSGEQLLAMVALGFLLAPPFVRNVRAPALAVKGELFVDAAVVAGLSPRRIIVRHIFPRVLGPVLVQGALTAAVALQFVVGLAFLGFGAQPPAPDWGSVIAAGSQVINTSPWPVLSGGFALGLVTLTLVLVGDGIRDAAVGAWAGAPRARRRAGHLVPAQAEEAAEAAEAAAAAPAGSGGSPLLTVRNLSVAFTVSGLPRRVVSGVSLSIAPGESVGIVGESGCGKTSVARAVARLLAQGGEIAGGAIEFDGRDVAALSGRQLLDYRRHAVSYVAQDPMTALDPTLRVGTLMRRVVMASEGLSRKAADARVADLLAQVHLPDPAVVARRYPHELSGGMAQRIGIARAIATRPRLLIADEPTTALDVTVQAEILALLRSLQQDLGMAVLLVSHDWGVVAQVCDRVMVMYAGQVVEAGALEQVARRPAHPYTAALLACRPSSVVNDDLELPAIRGSVVAPGEWPVGCRFAPRCDHRTDSCTLAPIPVAEVATGHSARCINDLRSAGNREGVTAGV